MQESKEDFLEPPLVARDALKEEITQPNKPGDTISDEATLALQELVNVYLKTKDPAIQQKLLQLSRALLNVALGEVTALFSPPPVPRPETPTSGVQFFQEPLVNVSTIRGQPGHTRMASSYSTPVQTYVDRSQTPSPVPLKSR